MSALRSKVLGIFKKLHKTRMRVFEGDERALTAARQKINDGFIKNKYVKDEQAIQEMIKFGEDIELELRTQVIQAREVKPGVFEARITEGIVKLDNIPYDDNAIPEDGVKGTNKCCQSVKK